MKHPEWDTPISVGPIPTVRSQKIAYKLKPKIPPFHRFVRFDIYGLSEPSIFTFFTPHKIVFQKTAVMGHTVFDI